MGTLANIFSLLALVLAVVFAVIDKLSLVTAGLIILLAVAVLLKPPPPIA